MCAALFTLTNAISGLTNGCNTRPTVVNAIHHHMPTWQHSAHYRSAVTYSLSSNDGFCLYLLQVCCFGTFGIDIYITGAHFVPVFLFVHPPHVSICLSREWAVSSRCSFGTDLITYLFSLSYSKLLSLSEFCWELTFSSLPSSCQHSILPLPRLLISSPPHGLILRALCRCTFFSPGFWAFNVATSLCSFL